MWRYDESFGALFFFGGFGLATQYYFLTGKTVTAMGEGSGILVTSISKNESYPIAHAIYYHLIANS
jgi:hypothetical protein